MRPYPCITGLLLTVLVTLGFAGDRSATWAFPEAAIVNPSWALDFDYDKPRAIAVQDAAGHTRWYWYMTYKVTNNTDEDQLFVPEFTIATDQGDVIAAGRNVPTNVFDAIRRQVKNPMIDSPIQVVGNLLQGADYAKESVAIWPAFVGDIDEFTVFVAGLSGDSTTIRNPVTGEEVLMRRNTMLTYKTPGNHASPQGQPVVFVSEQQVMR